VHEKAILLEKDARLEDGEFILRSFKMFRLEDRIQFLHRKFSGKPFDGEAIWWSRLKDAMLIRNKLTHPKGAHPLTTQNVRDALTAIIAVLDATYVAIYKKGLSCGRSRVALSTKLLADCLASARWSFGCSFDTVTIKMISLPPPSRRTTAPPARARS
jgi:hypothetical protein